jgi:MSHA biogenesis protein MshE
MGAEGYVVATSLRAVLAQRLVRRICQSCAAEVQLSAQEQSWLKTRHGENVNTAGFKQGSGCTQCNNTGYHGRIGIFELLEMNPELTDALRRNNSSDFAKAANAQDGFFTLTDCAMAYARRGITTIEEVIRVAGQVD